MRCFRLAATALAFALPIAVGAQGTISTQGLGYPPGQLSTWALSTGGALAEFDPASPLNPAAIATLPSAALFLHYAPESRRVTVGDVSEDAVVVRFPVIGAVLTLGGRGAVGIGTSTLLDRTWATTRRLDVDADGQAIVETFQSRGGMNDVRLAGGWSLGEQLQIGVAAHAITGVNRLTVTRLDERGMDANFEQASEVGFSGIAGSAGVLWSPSRLFAVGASGRLGGTVRAKLGDSTIASATVPARVGGAVRYAGLTGASLAARVEWQGWSSMEGLGRTSLDARDVWEYGVGADVAGPQLLGTPVGLRIGARWRDLPFAIAGDQPSEQALTGGAGLLFAQGRVLLDLAVERARREAAGARETSWLVGVGLTVQP